MPALHDTSLRRIYFPNTPEASDQRRLSACADHLLTWFTVSGSLLHQLHVIRDPGLVVERFERTVVAHVHKETLVG